MGNASIFPLLINFGFRCGETGSLRTLYSPRLLLIGGERSCLLWRFVRTGYAYVYSASELGSNSTAFYWMMVGNRSWCVWCLSLMVNPQL